MLREIETNVQNTTADCSGGRPGPTGISYRELGANYLAAKITHPKFFPFRNTNKTFST